MGGWVGWIPCCCVVFGRVCLIPPGLLLPTWEVSFLLRRPCQTFPMLHFPTTTYTGRKERCISEGLPLPVPPEGEAFYYIHILTLHTIPSVGRQFQFTEKEEDGYCYEHMPPQEGELNSLAFVVYLGLFSPRQDLAISWRAVPNSHWPSYGPFCNPIHCPCPSTT